MRNYLTGALASLALSLIFSPAHTSPPFDTAPVHATVYDIDSGRPVATTAVELELFPPEHGARTIPSLICVPQSGSQPLRTFTAQTDANGGFVMEAVGGDYLA